MNQDKQTPSIACDNNHFFFQQNVITTIIYIYIHINIKVYHYLFSSDICTILWYNFHDNFDFFFFDWSKIIERKK